MNNSKDINVLSKSLKSLIEDQEVGSDPPAERLTLTINDLAIKENESREAKENLELIFNTSPDTVLITSLADGYIVDINEGFTALSGYIRAEVIGKSSKEVNIWKNQ